jgi:hypothetical protein
MLGLIVLSVVLVVTAVFVVVGILMNNSADRNEDAEGRL